MINKCKKCEEHLALINTLQQKIEELQTRGNKILKVEEPSVEKVVDLPEESISGVWRGIDSPVQTKKSIF